MCAADPGTWCSRFYQWTNNDFLAQSADAIVSKTLTITLIVIVALLARALIHRAITRLIEGATNGAVSRLVRSRAPMRLRNSTAPLISQRRAQRARTVGSVLRSMTSAIVLLVAAVMILAEFNVALGPILASAGIVGVAIGFGAQNLVRDFLSGMFMLLEDQYGVGDIVDLGAATGTVEAVGLRITTIRDLKGTVWYVRNGEIQRVGNMSQGFAVAVVDVPVGYSVDTAAATEVAGKAATERLEQEDLAGDVLEPPEVLGVDRVTNEGLTLRLTVRVSPGRQWAVQRALNAAIADALDEAGIPRPLVFAGPNG
ncbi:mechanosensitive ion channel family protein [Pseudonocardia sp. K10HN5]|uniref:Mechanosensitive ion channel family protein n=2 Tax=Pseudonocardia acidicola TaxID=2724939 RepID=A0ABX1SIQ6_9PSEU|nr:mechanosensitive ion channel family protein [Pseudonocardia acidicola]NMI01457.1 mechanosensitive ion channel family protein [Pseudonocardia acidicola]